MDPDEPSTASSRAASSPGRFRIATRASRLAVWQAEHVAALLREHFPSSAVEVIRMTTRGDRIVDRPLADIGGKGLFTKELETAMLEGRADLAVHSLKDVPMDLAEPFELAAILQREDPRDAFVSNHYPDLQSLPHGATVGTSSVRRAALLLDLRPDLRIESLRGNLDTRLGKLDDGRYDAIVLATAGLVRLGAQERIRHRLDTAMMLPAPGQGAIAIESLRACPGMGAAMQRLSHRATWLCTLAERQVSRRLGGNCRTPLAAHGQWLEEPVGSAPTRRRLGLRAFLAVEGAPPRRAHDCAVVSTAQEAEALGAVVAERLLGEPG